MELKYPKNMHPNDRKAAAAKIREARKGLTGFQRVALGKAESALQRMKAMDDRSAIKAAIQNSPRRQERLAQRASLMAKKISGQHAKRNLGRAALIGGTVAAGGALGYHLQRKARERQANQMAQPQPQQQQPQQTKTAEELEKLAAPLDGVRNFYYKATLTGPRLPWVKRRSARRNAKYNDRKQRYEAASAGVDDLAHRGGRKYRKARKLQGKAAGKFRSASLRKYKTDKLLNRLQARQDKYDARQMAKTAAYISGKPGRANIINRNKHQLASSFLLTAPQVALTLAASDGDAAGAISGVTRGATIRDVSNEDRRRGYHHHKRVVAQGLRGLDTTGAVGNTDKVNKLRTKLQQANTDQRKEKVLDKAMTKAHRYGMRANIEHADADDYAARNQAFGDNKYVKKRLDKMRTRARETGATAKHYHNVANMAANSISPEYMSDNLVSRKTLQG